VNHDTTAAFAIFIEYCHGVLSVVLRTVVDHPAVKVAVVVNVLAPEAALTLLYVSVFAQTCVVTMLWNWSTARILVMTNAMFAHTILGLP